MRARRRIVSAGTALSMSSQILGLSLFIMLLAFFIVLNAISSYEQTKVNPVLQSVGYTFASRVEQEKVNKDPSVTQDEDQSLYEGDTLERLQALFNAQLPSHEAVVSERKGTMHVKLSFDEFEQAVMAIGQYDALEKREEGNEEEEKLMKNFFLPTLVSLMRRNVGTLTYRIDMLLNVEENPARLQNKQPQKIIVLMKRMSALTDKMQDAGLPPKLMSSGLQKGEEGTVELLFRYHIPFDPGGAVEEGLLPDSAGVEQTDHE